MKHRMSPSEVSAGLRNLGERYRELGEGVAGLTSREKVPIGGLGFGDWCHFTSRRAASIKAIADGLAESEEVSDDLSVIAEEAAFANSSMTDAQVQLDRLIDELGCREDDVAGLKECLELAKGIYQLLAKGEESTRSIVGMLRTSEEEGS